MFTANYIETVKPISVKPIFDIYIIKIFGANPAPAPGYVIWVGSALTRSPGGLEYPPPSPPLTTRRTWAQGLHWAKSACFCRIHTQLKQIIYVRCIINILK